MVFVPSKKKYQDPEKNYGYDYRESYLLYKNEKRYFWHIKGATRKQSTQEPILFVQFHGNAQNMSSHFTTMATILDRGHDLITYDYAGYGKSEGQPNMRGLVSEVHSFLKYVLKEYSNKKIVLVGQSLGGILLLKALELHGHDQRISSVVIDSSFSSFRDVAFNKMSRGVVTFLFSPLSYLLVSDKFAPRIDQISREYKVIVLHSKKDPVIPYQFGLEIYNKLRTKKVLITYDSSTHILSFLSPPVLARVLEEI